MDKKYTLPEDNAPKMACEPIVACAIPQEQVVMDYHMFDKFEIPQTYEEAMSMGLMDLEVARKELHAFVDELAIEYDLQ